MFTHLSNRKYSFLPLQQTQDFALDDGNIFILGPAYFLASGDSYLLAILNSEIVWQYLKETLPSVQGDSLVLRPAYIQNFPIPDAPQKERDGVARLAKQAQSLHTHRHKRVEKFLRRSGSRPPSPPAAIRSSSRGHSQQRNSAEGRSGLD